MKMETTESLIFLAPLGVFTKIKFTVVWDIYKFPVDEWEEQFMLQPENCDQMKTVREKEFSFRQT